MSSFRFNFSGSNDSDETQRCEKSDEILWLESDEVIPETQLKNLDDMVKFATMFTYEDVEIGHVIAKEAVLSMDNSKMNEVELAEKEHSDLIAGKYEGGLKIWECTSDLIEYLVRNEDKIVFKDQKVLDLGCGAGILGIYALIKGAKVTFQDYNKEVLECVTIPNVLLNLEEDEREVELRKCKFYSGDWESFNKILPNDEVFDVILTSETIYNTNNYNKLLDIFSKRLSKDRVVYVAAKTYYFGVGGGTRQFENSIDKRESLHREVCWKSTGGIQREIIKITRL